MLYYTERDEDFVSQDHAISLVPGLNPTVTFLNSQTKLLGKPYTNCNNEKNYSQLTCEVHNFMAKVIETCDCFPAYDDNFKRLPNFEELKPCNFFEQSTCFSKMHNDFDKAEYAHKCLPSCIHNRVEHREIAVSYYFEIMIIKIL